MDSILADVSNAGTSLASTGKPDMSGKKSKKQGKDRTSIINAVIGPLDEVDDENVESVSSRSSTGRRMTASPGQIASFIAGLDKSGSSNGSNASRQNAESQLNLSSSDSDDSPAKSNPPRELTAFNSSSSTAQLSAAPAPVMLPTIPTVPGLPLPEAPEHDLHDDYADVWGNFGAGRESMLVRMGGGRQSIIPADIADLLAEDSGMDASEAGAAGRRASMMPPPPPPSVASILPPADTTVPFNSSTVGQAGVLGTASKGGHRVKTPGKSLMKGTAGATTGRKRNVVFGSPQAAIVDQTVAVEAAGAITHLDPQLAKQAYGMHKSEPELGRLSFDDQTGSTSMSMSMLSAAAPAEAKENPAAVPASPARKIVGDGMDGDGDVIMAMTPAPKAAAAASAPFASPSGRPPRAPSTPKSAQKAAVLAAEQATAAPTAGGGSPTVRRSPRLSSAPLPDPSPIVTAPGGAAFPAAIAAAAGAFNGTQTVVLASMGSLDDSLALPPSAVAQTTTGLDAATKAQVAAVTVAPVGRSLSPKAGMAAAGAALGVKAGGAKGANRRATFSVVPGLGLVMGGAELPRRQVRQAAAAGPAPGPMAPPPVPAPAPKPSPQADSMDGSMDMDLAADRTVGSVDMRKLDMLLGDQSLSDSMLQATPAAMFSKAPRRRSSGKKGAAAAELQTQQSAAGDITVSLGLTGSSVPAFPVAAGAPAPTGGIFGVSGLLGARGKKGGALQAQAAEDVTVQAPTTLAGLLASERAAGPSTSAGSSSMDVTTSLPTSLSALMRDEGLRAGPAPFVLPQSLGHLAMGAGYGMGGGMQEEEEGEEESMLAEGASMLGVAGGLSMVQEGDALDVTAHLAAEGVKPVVRPATPQQKKAAAAGKRKGAGSVSNRTAADLDLSGDSSDQSTSSVDTAAIVEEEARLLERAMPGLTPNRAAMLASTRAAGSAAKAASAGKSRSAASVEGKALSFDAAPAPVVAHRKYADAETNTSLAVTPSEAAAQGSTSSSRSSTKRGAAQISAEGSATQADAAPDNASSKRSRRSSAAASTRSTATSVAATVAVGTATSTSQLHASVSSTSAAISVRSSASGTSSSSSSSSSGRLLVDIDGLHMPTITGRLSMAPPKAQHTQGMLIDTDGLHMSSPTGTRAPSAMATVAPPAIAPVHQPIVAAAAERVASPALAQPQVPMAEPAQPSSAAAASPAAVPATPAAPTPAPVATPATRASASAAAAATAKKSTGGKSRAAAAAEAARIDQEQAAAAAEEMNRQLKEQELAVLASAAAESALGWLPPMLQGTGWSIVKAEPQAQQAAAAVSLQHMHPDGSAHTLVVLVTQADSPVQAVACQHVASTSQSAQEASGYEQGGIAAFHKAACKNVADAILTQLASASVPLQSVCTQATSLFAAVNALCSEVASVRAGHAVRFTEEEEQGEGSGAAASWCIAMDFMRGQRATAVKARVLLRLPLAADCSAGCVYSYPSLAEALRMEVQVHAGPVTMGAALGQAMQVAQVEHLACRSGKAGLLAALAKAGAEELKSSK